MSDRPKTKEELAYLVRNEPELQRNQRENPDNVCPNCGGSKALCEYRERAAREW
jgi:hypothetical protein